MRTLCRHRESNTVSETRDLRLQRAVLEPQSHLQLMRTRQMGNAQRSQDSVFHQAAVLREWMRGVLSSQYEPREKRDVVVEHGLSLRPLKPQCRWALASVLAQVFHDCYLECRGLDAEQGMMHHFSQTESLYGHQHYPQRYR